MYRRQRPTPAGANLAALGDSRFEAADLLFAGMCDPRCLLAMESPAGDRDACVCRCGGVWHAALVGAEVLPQPWWCGSCGACAEDCLDEREQRCCTECQHPAAVRRAATRVVRELRARAS